MLISRKIRMAEEFQHGNGYYLVHKMWVGNTGQEVGVVTKK